MANAGQIRVKVTASVAVGPGVRDGIRWHSLTDLRCRTCFGLYRMAEILTRLADRVDSPRNHPR